MKGCIINGTMDKLMGGGTEEQEKTIEQTED
jgi:hypothetical protein